jgi:hypothetical protein
MSFDKQLECCQFLSSLTALAWVVSTCQAGSCLHAEGGNSPPCGQYASFAKVTFMHVMKEWLGLGPHQGLFGLAYLCG